jgi:hypothetical protein
MTTRLCVCEVADSTGSLFPLTTYQEALPESLVDRSITHAAH